MKNAQKYTCLVASFCLAVAGVCAVEFFRTQYPPFGNHFRGPPRDDIPALFDPEYVLADEASSMDEAEMVLGVTLNGIARAYPLRILSWHELVNEHYGDKPVLVSW